MRRALLLTAALTLLAAACGDARADQGSPTTTDAAARSNAFVDSVELAFLESYPVQVRATITGTVPTPCHTAEWQSTRDGGTVTLEVFSTSDPDQVCAQVLEPFKIVVDVGSFETGSYTLMVNGEAYPFEI